MQSILKNREFLLLFIILALASFFRLWQLGQIPPGLYPDVAIYANDAFESLKTGNFKVFYPENNGREGLYMWILALSFSLFGVSIWSIKIVTATAGILTVLGLYLLIKELFNNVTIKQFNNETVALLSSFFLATSFWHVNFSRIGFRAILLPLVLVFAFYFFFKGFHRRRIFNVLLAGVLFGLGFYTYISYRFIVLLLAFLLISFLFVFFRQKLQRKYLLFLFTFLFSIFLVALPIGFYFLENPQDFSSRASGVSVFAQENPLKAFLISFVAHLGMFNVYGDSNWRHNFPGSPMLFFPIGVLFLIGIIFSAREFLFAAKQKNISFIILQGTLLGWFFVFLLPGILTAEGVPHALRVIGVIPIVYVFSGMGGLLFYEWVKKRIQDKRLLFILFSLFFIFVTIAEFNKYFFLWAKNQNVEGAFTKKFAEIGYYLNSLPLDYQKYVIVNEAGVPVPFPNGIPMSAQTIMFIENTKFGSPQSVYLLPENIDKIKIKEKTPNQSLRDGTGQAVIVPMKYEQNLVTDLQRRFPQGEIEEKNGILVYKIND